jgi:hypothetical protein
MRLIYEKSIKKEVLQQIRRFEPTQIDITIDFTWEELKARVTIKLYRHDYKQCVDLKNEIQLDVKTDYTSTYSRFEFTVHNYKNALLAVLLDNCYIAPYSHNIDKMKSEHGIDTWLDTVIVSNDSVEVYYDKVCNEYGMVIYKRGVAV